ncbi:MAG: hypothetical protein COV74_03825 [Candidatus Omnitrophica bacterium CG11_big_fil_rev_8_21_14_0_20_45_26]|uniref:ABC transporter permease n=1 Tax=Candidatus Abzuiibacterium crystallinum TaxID=1974748 RepID=A0A2H0LSR0_9BACT|nr:MAG: hypothetical protein COV74_03825 [Candidatus Omnitrophica bacterium CG11_big_fil_rev_8_21_14_0_20_45_26]PIW65604.1 MAG: hypothetical protein COW12_01000 [Candidatus Omnitrophica bacterium CG12_big_fil_rev_8_21_14_0_65_45_16]
MNIGVYDISLIRLSLAFIPVLGVAFVYWRWSHQEKVIYDGTVRMLVQLLLIGFALNFIFAANHPILMLCVLCFMLAVASWIALRPMQALRLKLYPVTLLAISTGGITMLILIIFGVLGLSNWNQPRYIIPLAGMIFANAMNSVSLAAERLQAEMKRDQLFEEARSAAFRAALLPTINSFFAVGLVSIPGMMTGQILAGVSPFIAARYQIMVMCMILGAAGIASAVYLSFQKPKP